MCDLETRILCECHIEKVSLHGSWTRLVIVDNNCQCQQLFIVNISFTNVATTKTFSNTVLGLAVDNERLVLTTNIDIQC